MLRIENRLVSFKNEKPPSVPTFWKNVEENQVCYFTWPKKQATQVI